MSSLLELKNKLKKEKDLIVLKQIQLEIDEQIIESRDKWWFNTNCFNKSKSNSNSNSNSNNLDFVSVTSTLERLLDPIIINNYSNHIDKPYIITKNNTLGKRKNIK